jgi:hypothetical protein
VKTRIASLLANRRPLAAAGRASARASQGTGMSSTERNAVTVRSHAKAPSAGSTTGTGSSRGLIGSAFATRGASSESDGSGASSSRFRIRFSILALSGALLALFAILPVAASAETLELRFSGSGGGTVRIEPFNAMECTSTCATPAKGAADTTAGSNVLTNLIAARGTATLTAGSASLTSVTTTTGRFVVGQPISAAGIPAGTTVIATNAANPGTNPTSLTLSQPVEAGHSGTAIALVSSGPQPFAKGQVISGAGIPASTRIAAIAPGSLTLSNSATASASGIALTVAQQLDAESDGTIEAFASPDEGSAFFGWSGVTCAGGVLSNPCGFPPPSFTNVTLTAAFGPSPPLPAATTGGASKGTDFYSASVAGEVDPEGTAVTGCRVEYGETTAYGSSSSCDQAPAAIGSGTAAVPVTASIGLLEPSTLYHYRLTASNPGGSAFGEDHTFTSDPAPDDPCPNAPRRAEQGAGSLLLPDCRAYELVSSGDSHGANVTLVNGGSLAPAIIDAGGRSVFFSQSLGDPPSIQGTESNAVIAQRGASGWVDVAAEPEPDQTEPQPGSVYPSADLTTLLWNKSTPNQARQREVVWTFTHLDGAPTAASPVFAPILLSGPPTPAARVQGATPDFSHFVFGVQGRTLLAGEPLAAVGNLYELSGAGTTSASLSLVNQEGAGGPQIGGACGATLGGYINVSNVATRAISEDGSVVYFSSRPGAAQAAACDSTVPVRIFRRVNTDAPIEVSHSECTRVSPACANVGDDKYQGASKDGTRALFTSTRQLTNTDTDATEDLYLYDSSAAPGAKLTQLSAGVATANHPVPGAGAQVLGVLDNAADGSRIYFVAKGELTAAANPNGETAAPNANNLYVYDVEEARLSFVGRLAAADEHLLWSTEGREREAYALPASGTGRYLFFVSAAPLVAADTDSATDLYRYDDAGSPRLLTCLSCQASGPFPVGVFPRNVGQSRADAAQESPATADGSTAVFATTEPLLPAADHNTVGDAYEWRETEPGQGVLALVSGGSGLSLPAHNAGQTVPPITPWISANGDDIQFITAAALLPSDGDGAADVYDARVAGGFPEPAPPPGCEGDLGCHGGAGSPPAAAAPATTAPPDGGNVVRPGPCRKAQVRRAGRCVRKHRPKRHRRGKHSRGSANHGEGSR